MSNPRVPGFVCISTCRCGVRLVAGDAVELDRLRGEHADFHVEQGEDSSW
ncbi:MAG: hypothetical protein V3U30_02885 [Thermoplasmata archaeon]